MEQAQVANKSSLKAKVQKLGSTLSSMVMPNIGALIAWGVLTALFIPDGYLPNESFATMVSPMLTYLIPILIGYTGGKVIAGDRGAVVGAIATMGVIVGTDIPMLLGAMIMGPLGGWVIKKFDEMFQDKIRAGFEMLVNNFSAGLIGFALALIGFVAIGPVVNTLTEAMASGVEVIVNAHLIPLANVFIEPAKILFLNNAINHGILTPLGTEQVSEFGKSILYLLEANPGPGLGVLLAFTLFGKGAAKSSAPGAIIIHFIGGIHEIYFPYVMMKPIMFLAVIAGGVSGSFTFQLLGAGLRAPASPGSIIAIMAMTPFNSVMSVVSVLAGIAVGAGVSFVIAAAILKADAKNTVDNFEEQVQQTQAAKLSSKGIAVQPVSGINRIVFACDAGMGSSAMGASILRKKVKEAGLAQQVTNAAINNLQDDANALIVTQEELQERAKQKAPHATFVAVENFLNSPRYDEIVASLSGNGGTPEKKSETLRPEEQLPAHALKHVSEIILAHDDRKGSATMAKKVVQDLLTKESLAVPIRKSHINDLHANATSLVITKESLTQQAKDTAPEAVHFSVNSLMGNTNYQRIVSSLKETV
ncbi:PTS system mannitol-specific IICBA component [Enterococcus sp. 8G7_MSG3316]|uniref:PTS system mannitol-specific EIICB component n=1 Tax=Candidatus Enterococcus testudinis TaxID=1834191 RepID=A0A242AAP2_9ENTE|nr:PTS mannitol transporter subunit IICBA [Enterococcus sp. 8G7_MSG3316]OTN77989.1 PTS system mannitol-specific IICBA component [Enterococcus sp. 8G7_MSG3316]